MDDFDRCLQEQLKDEEFRKEWERLKPEYDKEIAKIKAQNSNNEKTS